MSLVSVIVPAHNAEATVAETIESALQQTHADLEIIVVDDGSSDGTVALCNAYRARDTRIRVISTAQAGVASARNTGIENANGQFIAPLDADDFGAQESQQRGAIRPGDISAEIEYTNAGEYAAKGI